MSGEAFPRLRRHRLAHLSAQGWQRVLDQRWDAEARECLRHWAGHDLPVVITRQPAPMACGSDTVSLGLSAPIAWRRRSLVIRASPTDHGRHHEFPPLRDVLRHVPNESLPALHTLDAVLVEHGLGAHVYGSLGWQHVSGLPYLHAASDVDLWIGVDTPEAADRAVAVLQQHAPHAMRIDGELVLPDGRAVAWREWFAWRAGKCSALLVKGLHAANIVRTLDWAAEARGAPQAGRCIA